MAFLQKKPQYTDEVRYFSSGLTKTVLLVGLGNVGPEYDLTRHNVGFITIDMFVDKTDEMGPWSLKKDLKSHLSIGQLGQTRVIAIKPTTMMNSSGEAVQAVAAFYKLKLSDIVVLHDELDINFGQIRLRIGGSDAGNNGIKSITQHIGEAYGRIRIGVGPKTPTRMATADFVLQKFSTDEQAELDNLCRETNAILTEYIYGGELPHETRSFIL
jgi:PTH1 family peptidyl-tRNA hydrolase